MRIRTTAVLALTAALALPAVASAQRPSIDVDTATARVTAHARETMQRDNAAIAATSPISDRERQNALADGFDWSIDAPTRSFDVECEAETRVRAICSVEYTRTDGSTFEEDFTVFVTRHGNLRLLGA